MKSIKTETGCTVSLVDHMGSDKAIVDAARVSYRSNNERKHSEEEDTRLIRYLYKNKHTSPFEMSELKFVLENVPMYITQQILRHRTASVNCLSARYSEMPDTFYEPKPFQCTGQAVKNKQAGTDIPIKECEEISLEIKDFHKKAHELYTKHLKLGLRRELARGILPQNLCTSFVFKIDLKNLLHFLKLRQSEHAQYEVRVIADAMFELIKPLFPATISSFEEFDLGEKHA